MTVLFSQAELQAAIESGRILRWPAVTGTDEIFCDLADGRVFKGSAQVGGSCVSPPDGESADRGAIEGAFPEWVLPSAIPAVEDWRALEAAAVPVFLHAGRIVIGPLLSNDANGGCYRCVAIRMLASSPHGHVLANAWRRTFPVGEWVVTQLTDRMGRLRELAGSVRNEPGAAASISLTNGRERTHRVANLPGHPQHAATTLTELAGLS